MLGWPGMVLCDSRVAPVMSMNGRPSRPHRMMGAVCTHILLI